jgi:hypothetical protein
MSADNWATCPSCRATATTAFETKAKDSFQIPPDWGGPKKGPTK